MRSGAYTIALPSVQDVTLGKLFFFKISLKFFKMVFIFY